MPLGQDRENNIITPFEDWPVYKKYVLDRIEQQDANHKEICKKLDELKESFEEKYVSKEEIDTQKKLVFGFATMILVGFGTIMVSVVNKALGFIGVVK